MHSPKGAIGRGLVFVGFAASVGTLYLLYRQFWGAASTEGKWGIAFVSSFAWFFLAFAVLQEYRLARKARHAEASPFFHEILQKCVGGAREEFATSREVQSLVQEICEELANGFSLVSGTRCAACVKVIDQAPDAHETQEPQLSVSTLCRDRKARERRSRGQEITHWLHANTDFLEIFRSLHKPNGRAFFENDLPSRKNYINTSFELYGEPKEPGVPFVRTWIQKRQWPLPYKSTIVAAILPQEFSEKEQLAGFLCLDSTSVRAFSGRYDLPWVLAVATALHPVVWKWIELVYSETGASDAQGSDSDLQARRTPGREGDLH